MPEWLQDSIAGNGISIPFNVLLARLAVSLVLGCAVASIYFISQRKERSETFAFVTTLVLLTVLISMVTMVIGNSVARAFSLAGALAIIRFRTIVEDTRDTAFVIFAVVVGMAVGAGFLFIALAGIPVVALATFVLSLWGWARLKWTACNKRLTVRLRLGCNPEEVLGKSFEAHFDSTRLIAATTARQGSALDLTYQTRLRQRDSVIALVTELNGLEGVQAVELSEMG
jgi:uncharacterized membrane protein YhiD involved in acid resistance